jgi:ABC-type amino acid transport system permease subunit
MYWTAEREEKRDRGGQTAYGAEIVVRRGLQAVPRGQFDAYRALGLPPYHALTRVILPQALSQIVPGFGSLTVDMVKWASIASFVGVQDVLCAANSVRSIIYETVAVFPYRASS